MIYLKGALTHTGEGKSSHTWNFIIKLYFYTMYMTFIIMAHIVLFSVKCQYHFTEQQHIIALLEPRVRHN